MAAFSQAAAALRALVDAAPHGLPVVHDNAPDAEPASQDSWIRWRFDASSADAMSPSGSKGRLRGIARGVVHGPLDEGDAVTAAAAESLAAYLRDAAPGALRVRSAFARAGHREGRWWTARVDAAWTYDYPRAARPAAPQPGPGLVGLAKAASVIRQLAAAALPGKVVLFDNDPTPEPSGGGSWARVRVRAEQSRKSHNPGRHRVSGVVVVQAFGPIERGDAEAMSVAEAVADAVELTSLPGGAVVDAMVPVGSMRAGRWWMVTAQATLHFDTQGTT